MPEAPQIRSLVVLGGTGDLAGRLLLPGLAELVAAGGGDGLGAVIAVGLDDRADDDYREWARERLAEHAGAVPDDVRDRVVRTLRYRQGDVTSAEDLRAVLGETDGAAVVYLALPNTVFRPTLEALEEAGLRLGLSSAAARER